MREIPTLVTIVLVGLLLLGEAAAQSLRFELTLDAQTFVEGEEIWATLTLTNISGSEMRVPWSVLTEDVSLTFEVRAEQHGLVKPVADGTWDFFKEPPPLRLQAGDQRQEIFNISWKFAEIKPAGILRPFTLSMKPGRYSIRAVTFAGSDSLFSNIVTFQVSSPTGRNRTALTKIREIEQVYMESRETARPMFEAFVRQYADVPYAEVAYGRLIFEERVLKHDVSGTLMLVRELAGRFPNRSRTIRELRSLLPLLEDTDRINLLDSIEVTYRGTKVGDFAKRHQVRNK